MANWDGWLIIFAKYPEPGRVMTRLTPPLSHAQALEVQRACLYHVLEASRKLQPASLVVAVAPDERLPAMQALLGDAEVWPQGGGDLGARLERVGRRAFDAGARWVCFLGTDSPLLPWEHLEQLPEMLQQADAALGPCADGGYYYLAMTSTQAALLNGIPWGTDGVARQTRKQALATGVRLVEGPVSYDIDRYDDLLRAHGDLLALGECGPLATTIARVVDGPNEVKVE